MIFKIISKEELKESLSQREISLLVNKDRNVEEDLVRIKKSWENKESGILNEIRKRTHIEISTKEITCFLNPYNTDGFYGENKIILGLVDLNTETDLMVIAHELFHIFYWRKVKEMGLSKSNLGEEESWEWCLAEVTVFFLQRDLQKLWPDTKIEIYPETKEVYEKVKDFWESESFENYLTKSYKLLENGERY